jgi:hypothetical protein
MYIFEVCICILNEKMINIIYICVFYININVCIYHIALKKSKYSTTIFILFKYIFWVRFRWVSGQV